MNHFIKNKIRKTTLANGLDVILYRDNSLPIVAINIWYKTGSANETDGKTGFAHLFEHMMFQGSSNIAKEQHFKFIQEAGGTLNGSTSTDKTNYYETLPSNNLELGLWLESDRMGFLLPALTQEKLDNQKEVVMNERRQRYDNQPYGRAWEILFSTLFPKDHPYNWPTIGWMKDIEAFNLDDVRNFFSKYYAPDNASLVIAGDIEFETAFAAVEKYFGEIPSAGIPESVIVPEYNLAESKTIIVKDKITLPRVYFAWRSCKYFSADDAAMDVLSDIFNGTKNSRLHKSLIHEMQIAQDVSCFQHSGKYDGSFIIAVTAKPGITLDQIKEKVFSEIEKLIQDGITEKELLRSVNGLKSGFLYSLQDIDSLADYLNNYNCLSGEPDYFAEDLSRYTELSGKNITDAAMKYLTKPFAEVRFLPEDEKL